jgi:small subunit ribosomal protein S20
MANTKSAQKAMRQTERRTAHNRAARSAVRTFVKKASLAVSEPSDDTAEIIRQAVKALDKAAKRGIIHPNAAARRKSRLMSRAHVLATSGPAAAPAEASPTRGRGRTTESRSASRTTRGPSRTTTRRSSSKKDS